MLKLLSRKPTRPDGPPAVSTDQTAARPTPAAPSLVLLVNDAAHASAFRLHAFPDAPSCAAFIQFWFPPSLRRGLIAFWSLPDGIAAEDPASPREVVLLVRDRADPEVVRPFSFTEYESALAFLRAETAAGLDPRLVLLHWALPVTISTTDGGTARLTPARPPASRCKPLAGLDPNALPAAASELPAPVRAVPAARRHEAPQQAFAGFSSPPGRF